MSNSFPLVAIMKKGDISNMPTPIIAIDYGVFVEKIELGILGRIKAVEYNSTELQKLNKVFVTGDFKVVILTNVNQKIADKIASDLDAAGIVFSEVIYTKSYKDWINKTNAMFFTEDSDEMLAIGPRHSKRWSWLQWI